MPHLAPLPWNSVPLIVWTSLSTVSSVLWWHQVPKFPRITINSGHAPNKWNW